MVPSSLLYLSSQRTQLTTSNCRSKRPTRVVDVINSPLEVKRHFSAFIAYFPKWTTLLLPSLQPWAQQPSPALPPPGFLRVLRINQVSRIQKMIRDSWEPFWLPWWELTSPVSSWLPWWSSSFSWCSYWSFGFITLCRTLSWRLIPDSIGVDLKLKWKLAEEEGISFLLLLSERLTKATGIKK